MNTADHRSGAESTRTPRKPSGPPPRTTPRIWTPENVRAAVMCRNDDERRALAARLGTTVDAVRQISVRWRAAHSKTRPRHIWTDEEKETVATMRGRKALAEYARRIGVTEQAALSQRAKVRSETGLRGRNHRWTAHEVSEVQSLAGSREVRAWARRRGLSEDTAIYHWKQRSKA